MKISTMHDFCGISDDDCLCVCADQWQIGSRNKCLIEFVCQHITPSEAGPVIERNDFDHIEDSGLDSLHSGHELLIGFIFGIFFLVAVIFGMIIAYDAVLRYTARPRVNARVLYAIGPRSHSEACSEGSSAHNVTIEIE